MQHTRSHIPSTGTSADSTAGRYLLRDVVLLTVLIGLLFALFLGGRPLSVPDEGRYAEIPREMTATHDWLTPRLDGVLYFEKPPLVYWLTAASIRLFGLSEWSVRLVPALFALVGSLALYVAGAKLFGRAAGLLASLVLATSFLYYALSRLLTLDMPVTVLLTLSLLSFLVGIRRKPGAERRWWLYGFYFFTGLAVMTKGLMGFVLPAMVIGIWIIATGEWRVLGSMYLPTGLALFLAVAAPWHIAMAKTHPAFARFYFIHEHFERYLTKVHHHYKPFWFFVPVLIGGLFPWSPFAVQAVKHALPASWKERHHHRETIFLALWAVLIFLFFSASSSKLIPYILPVVPPLALLIGKYLGDAVGQHTVRGIRSGVNTLLVLSSLICVVLGGLARRRPDLVPHAAIPYLTCMIAILMAGAVAAWVLAKRQRIRSAVAAVAVSAVLFAVVASSVMPLVGSKSIKPLALALKSRLGPGDEVAAYRTYYQDLPVYLGRTVTVVGWTGEMEFGTTIEDTKGWMIDEAEFWRRWQGPKRMFLVTNRELFDTFLKKSGKTFYPTAETAYNVVLSNREVKQ